MFVDFNRVFKNKTQTQLSVPSAYVDYLNRSMPNGIKYVLDNNGNCTIVGTGEPITIGGIKINPTEDQKRILGDNFTKEDVLDYSYNSQEELPMVLEKDGYITINGKEFSILELTYNPYIPVKYISGECYMSPLEFPEPFQLTVDCNEYARTISIKRIPNRSISVAAYKSEEDDPLYLQYFVNDKTGEIKMNVSLDISKAKTIRDIVESASVYNAFLDGSATFAGKPLGIATGTEVAKKFNGISFWEKVMSIEEKLSVSFVPPQESVDLETIHIVEQLFQNLINKVPTRGNQIIDSIDADIKFSNPKRSVKNSLGKPISLEFEATSNIELFGVTKELPAIMWIFNSVLKEYTSKDGKQRLTLVDESVEKKRYVSMMYFVTADELKTYKSANQKEMFAAFRDAERPYKYLEK